MVALGTTGPTTPRFDRAIRREALSCRHADRAASASNATGYAEPGPALPVHARGLRGGGTPPAPDNLRLRGLTAPEGCSSARASARRGERIAADACVAGVA